MSGKPQDRKSFAERLFSFLDEEMPADTEDMRHDLESAGIDVAAEVDWVQTYVGKQLDAMKDQYLRDASSSQKRLMKRLVSARKNADETRKSKIDGLMSALRGGGEAKYLELQTQFSKLEKLTEDDLVSMLEDMVELDDWDNEETDR